MLRGDARYLSKTQPRIADPTGDRINHPTKRNRSCRLQNQTVGISSLHQSLHCIQLIVDKLADSSNKLSACQMTAQTAEVEIARHLDRRQQLWTNPPQQLSTDKDFRIAAIHGRSQQAAR